MLPDEVLTPNTRATPTFAALEATILGRALPPTARAPHKHRHCWLGRGRHAQAQARDGWLSIGWGIETIDLAAETVTFASAETATGKDGG